MKLKRKSVQKPWGQTVLPEVFGGQRKHKIGEIWFEPPEGITPALMVKYLFTSEKLSIQVHPNNRHAKRAGLAHGKDECWYVLEAEPGSVLGVGLTKEVSQTKLRAAVVCGEAEQLVDWKPVQAGDFFYVPAGTIHAIGPGIKLVEIQQNIDVTYRLYDYGRPRELHLDEALSVAKPTTYDMKYFQQTPADRSALLLNGPEFRVLQIVGDDLDSLSAISAAEWQVVPLAGQARVRGKLISEGNCGLCTKVSEIDLSKNGHSIVACTMK